VLLLLAMLVGFSRMYLGVHYPSDVTAGFALGTAAVLLAVAIGTNLPKLADVPRRADIPMLVLLGLHVGCASIYAARHPTRPPKQFADTKRLKHVATFEELVPKLPREARSMTSQRLLPINLVAVGPITSVTTQLESLGWKKNRPSDFFTRRISSPVFPAFVDSRPAEVSYERETSDSRTVLRLWPVDYAVTSATVYVGAISEEFLHNKFRSLQVYHLSPDVDLARDHFASVLKRQTTSTIEGYRARGQYDWKYPFFTHGAALLVDLRKPTS
jgi:undecaprenyl-diphosphatase